MRFTLFALGACLVLLARPAAAQTCNEKCVQQYDQNNNPIGWACHTTGTNKNCVAMTTQCSITTCGGSGATRLYTFVRIRATRAGSGSVAQPRTQIPYQCGEQ